jgi:hypothetical protein
MASPVQRSKFKVKGADGSLNLEPGTLDRVEGATLIVEL